MHLRRQVADLVVVARLGQRADFGEAEARPGVDQAGVDGQPRRVDDLGALGNGDVRAEGGDLSVLHHEHAVFDDAVGDGHDARVRQDEGASLGLRYPIGNYEQAEGEDEGK